MRYHSFSRAVAIAACLSASFPACRRDEYDTEAVSDASSTQGGTEAVARTSKSGATGGRSALLTTSLGSATGGANATTRTGSFGSTSPTGGARAFGGASSMSSTQTSAGTRSVVSSSTLGGAYPTGGASPIGGVNSAGGSSAISVGGTSARAGTSSTASHSSGGTSATTRTNSAGGTNASSNPSSSNGGATTAATSSTTPAGEAVTEFSPYFYTWGWGNSAYPFTGLEDLRSKTQLKSVTLAFVLSSGQCVATTDIQDHLNDVNAFRSLGGHVKASFGGANGTYLENACSDAPSLAKAISAFVTATNITDLDFDVEQSPAMDATVNQRRAQALKLVQAEKGITVSFTLAATPRDKWGTPGGLSAASLSVLRSTLDAQVEITRVNIMAMDYGSYFSGGNSMGALAISALTDTLAQLKSLMPGLSDSDGWHRLGVTPMIGQNDVSTEIFSLDDARTLISFAKEKRLGLVSFWAINRDQPCPYNSLAVCSQVNTKNFEFSAIFAEAG